MRINLSLSSLAQVNEVQSRGQSHREKTVGAQKDIHQHREESSRARGILASRAKSESFAYKGRQQDHRAQGRGERGSKNHRQDGRSKGSITSKI